MPRKPELSGLRRAFNFLPCNAFMIIDFIGLLISDNLITVNYQI